MNDSGCDICVRISRGVAAPEAAGAVELETVRNATAMLDYLKRS